MEEHLLVDPSASAMTRSSPAAVSLTIGPNARSNTSRFPSGDQAGALSPRHVGALQVVGRRVCDEPSEPIVKIASGLLPPYRRSNTMRSPSGE
jgi:hypothetical protein